MSKRSAPTTGILMSAVLLMAANALFAERINLEVYASRFDSIPLAVIDFKSLGGALAKDFPWQIIAEDLAWTGRFNVLRLEKPDSARMASSNIGVLINGSYSVSGNNVKVSCCFLDAGTRDTLLGRKYEGDLKALRAMAHKFSNEMVEVVLGEKGPFTRKIVYVKDEGRTKNLWSMDYDGYNQRAITNSPTINIFPTFADSTTIIWCSYLRGKPDLYKGSIVTGKSDIFMYSRYVTASPNISSIDGRVVFASSRNGNMDIFICEPDGSNSKQITFTKAVDTSPSWSPNGAQIAFISDRSGSPQVYVMDIDGSNQKRITFEGSYQDSPAWSPKGDKIAYQSQKDWKFDIWLVNPDGSNAAQVTTCPGNNEYPTWSPEASHIAFSSGRGSATDIYVVRADGSDLRRISQAGNAKMPDWSHF